MTMQSMITGTPVVITKTEEFWIRSIIDNENIFFIENNDVDFQIKNKILI